LQLRLGQGFCHKKGLKNEVSNGMIAVWIN
jgi:hypothetical protein